MQLMSDPLSDGSILAAVSRVCLALPEATRELKGQHASFTIRKRTFAYFLNNHHGDGIVAIACKTAVGENEEMVRRDPERFYLPAYIGVRGWVGLRLDLGEVDWQEVADLVSASYCLAAPRKLAAALVAQTGR